jgi:gas vesicle protein
MNKRRKLALMAGGSIIALSAVCGAVSANTPIDALAEGEETSQESLVSSSEEPITSKTADDIINEVWNKQVLGTTIGTIVGSIASVCIAFFASHKNRVDLKSALEVSRTSAQQLIEAHAYMDEVKQELKINDAKFDQAMKALLTTSELLSKTSERLEKVEQDNIDLKDALEQLKAVLVTMVQHDPDLVKSDTYKEIEKILGGK